MTQSDPTTRSTSNETLDEAREAGADIAGSLRDSAHDAAGKISAEASDAAEKAQDGAADELKDVASALRTAAENLRNGSPQDRAFSQLADTFADASDAMRDMDPGEMLTKVNSFARRNPLVFLGGAALVGFAATRAVKASAEGSSGGASHGNRPKASPAAGTFGGNPRSNPASVTPASGTTQQGA